MQHVIFKAAIYIQPTPNGFESSVGLDEKSNDRIKSAFLLRSKGNGRLNANPPSTMSTCSSLTPYFSSSKPKKKKKIKHLCWPIIDFDYGA